MTWRPLESVPDPLRLALYDAIRATVLQHDVRIGIERDGNGMLVVPMDNGDTVHVGLRLTTRTAARFGAREAVLYGLEGNAVYNGTSYGLAARAMLDVKTKAFLDVACDVLWQRARDHAEHAG